MPYQKKIDVGRTNGTWGDTAKWCSPMKMFEYMALKKLIISSNLPVLREILNESNCIICEPDDAEQWVRSIKKAKKQTDWANDLAEQAYTDVQQYSWRKRVKRLLES